MLKKPNYRVPEITASLGYLWGWWIEQHCVVPQGDLAGQPFVPTLDHRVWLANWGAIRSTAKPGELNMAFVYRTGQWMAAQKVGKSPGVAAETLLEFVGPALYDGRAQEGEFYACIDHGCSCGGVYEYTTNEPKGRPWATPRIQLAAVVEDQVENTYGALIPMIEMGPLSEVIPKTGEQFIRHPNGNRDSRIEIVTSKADSKLGARITAAKCDETGLWTESNNMKKFMRTLRRGAAAMGGRVSESTNPYDPAENSVAQDTLESRSTDVLKHHFPPPPELDFSKKKDREDIFRWNYRYSPWVDIRSIEAEAAAMMAENPAEAERFFGNRVVAGRGTWLEIAQFVQKAADGEDGRPQRITVQPRTKVAGGFDGSDNDDYTGIRLETLDGHQFTPRYGDNLKTLWRPEDWGGRIPRGEVNAAMNHLFNDFEIVRFYCDVMFWESEIDTWAAKYGEKIVIKWRTNRISAMHAALERFKTDFTGQDSKFTHDADEEVTTHIRNAIRRSRAVDPITKVRQYIIGKPGEKQKIDYAMSSVLAHEAAMDAIASGALTESNNLIYF